MVLFRRPWFFLLLLLLTVLEAAASESRVDIAPGLNGAWVRPDRGWDGRVVLMLHGFADDRDGAGDLTRSLAEALASRGIASLRINFRGEGDRKRTLIESTFTTRVEDTEAAQAWLLRQPGVRSDHVGAQGWSLGATTAIVLGARHPGWYRSLAVWSSPSGDQYAMWMMDPVAQQAVREGQATEEVPGWKRITTKREFYESFRGVDVDRDLARYPGAFLSVRGAKDYLPAHEEQFKRIAPGHPVETLTIEGADHIFDVFHPETGRAARALQATVEWFERTL